MPSNNEKILIFGEGQIGNLYKNYFDSNHVEAILSKVDITKTDEVESEITTVKPTVVINTAAVTNLEWCEKNKLETFHINVLGAENLAKSCDDHNVYFIHFSSGCIFESVDENDIKTETSQPQPASYYAWTKVWSENMIKYRRTDNFKYLILRPRQPISAEVNYKNMLVKFLTFTKFIDTPNTGTDLEDLMGWTSELIEKRFVGVLNVANDGWTTPYEIGLLLKKHVLPSLTIEKIEKAELDKMTPVKRVDAVLDVTLLKSLVKKVKPYRQRLEETVKKLGENFKVADKKLIEEELAKTLEQSKARTVVNEVWKDLLK